MSWIYGRCTSCNRIVLKGTAVKMWKHGLPASFRGGSDLKETDPCQHQLVMLKRGDTRIRASCVQCEAMLYGTRKPFVVQLVAVIFPRYELLVRAAARPRSPAQY